MSKPILIAFEGVDKVGKTTIRRGMIRDKTQFGPLLMDRFLASNFVYDTLYSREHHIRSYLDLEKSLLYSFDCVLVYLTCADSALRKRLTSTGHNFKKVSMKAIRAADNLFDFYFRASKFRKILIDTTNRSPEKVTDVILSFLDSKETVCTAHSRYIEKEQMMVSNSEALEIFVGKRESEVKEELNPDNKCEHLRPENLPILPMKDALKDIFEKQALFQERLGNMSQFRIANMREKSDFVKFELVNMNLEFAELLNRLPHKHHKEYPPRALENWSSEKQRTESLFEYVDALHFFLNIALILGFSAEEIYYYFISKNEENHGRQDRGY